MVNREIWLSGVSNIYYSQTGKHTHLLMQYGCKICMFLFLLEYHCCGTLASRYSGSFTFLIFNTRVPFSLSHMKTLFFCPSRYFSSGYLNHKSGRGTLGWHPRVSGKLAGTPELRSVRCREMAAWTRCCQLRCLSQ